MNAVRAVARIAAVLLSLAIVEGRTAAAGPVPAADGVVLDVPYLPQTQALCGGAATAMLFRYWGDAHASVQQFAPLVDRQAGGIHDTDLVEAIRERHWTADRLHGSLETLSRELRAGRPPMILIEDRPQRYHYVIVVGLDSDAVVVHDPTWGPDRRMPLETLQRVWKPSGFWTLRVTRGAGATADTASPPADAPGPVPSTACERQLDAALDAISTSGLDVAEATLASLAAQCPADAGPRRELAGVRFAQRRFDEASELARSALGLDPDDGYAAEVLGSSRFMLDDVDGALRAWNRSGKPLLDSLRISGLSRTRYSLLAQALGLHPDALLTPDVFTVARRRLEAMPDLASTRLALRPDADGFAVADIAVVERATLPRTPLQWAATAGQAGVDRTLAVHIPGGTGQGESWSASWRWWEHRPNVALAFEAPLVSGPRGVWHVGLSWDAQAYGPASSSPLTERRLSGDIGMSTWLSGHVRVGLLSGVDAWTRPNGDVDRVVKAGADVEHRALGDRLVTTLSASRWVGLGGAAPFGSLGVDADFRNGLDPGPLVVTVRGGVSVASSAAPLALWSGAGEGRGRPPLLRAHGLLHDGRIDGPIFGRHLTFGSAELQHWLRVPRLLRVGAAIFADAASAQHRLPAASGRAVLVDTGAGLRLQVPGRGVFRLDYARGLLDRSGAWVLGWQLVP